MKIFLIAATVLFTGQLFSQEPNEAIFRQWYLHELSIENTLYLPAEYGYYPDIFIDENDNDNIVRFADANHVECTSQLLFSETAPQESFTIAGPEICLLKEQCNGDPNGPCTIIYNTHANFYYDTTQLPSSYTIVTNDDDTLTLTVINDNADVAVYGSAPILSAKNPSQNKFTLYPNPALNNISIYSPNSIDTITIYSITGTEIHTATVSSFDISFLTSGIYFIEVVSNGQKSVQKFIKR